MANMTDQRIRDAKKILERNDLGDYTVPTHGLYPFQWNWDSGLTALGLAHFNEARAWQELETLFTHQWEDGMVPHIIFHQADDGYFPGPEVWATQRDTPTSGITQPAVAGFVVNRLFLRAKNRQMAQDKAKILLPKIAKWHDWFYHHRDPHNTGLVAIIHPWESGRDNSIDWDEGLAHVPIDGVQPFVRRDITHANPAHRPTQAQYQRYIWLVQHFKSLNWDNQRLHDASPFQMVDPGFNGILIRSNFDIANLATQLGEHAIAKQATAQARKGLDALERLWCDAHGQYVCFNRITGKLVDSPSVGGLLAAFSPLKKERMDALEQRLKTMGNDVDFLVPSHDIKDQRFDPLRYWRGPAWLIVNYMIADGMAMAGKHDMASTIRKDSLDLIEKSGFAEYYDPLSGTACGGNQFSWTAAMVLEFLQG